VLVVCAPLTANAASFAVFGDNETDDFINGLAGHSATVVSDADIVNNGLGAFDAFVYTRDDANFGDSLSAAAAAVVKSFVSANVVLLNADFADDLDSDASLQRIYENAIDFIAGGGVGGYLGELAGAVAALDSNNNAFQPLGLLQGDAGIIGNGNGGANTNMSSAGGALSGVLLDGVALPQNLPNVSFGSRLSNFDSNDVVALFENQNPAILARGSVGNGGGANPVPLPAALPLALAAFGALGLVARRRHRG
jgi:hypothetical protein